VPVAFLRKDGGGGYAPIARPRFTIGSDLDCDLHDGADGVEDYHATVRLLRGEYVMLAKEGCSLWVNDKAVPMISLLDGDEVALSQGATPWQFRSRIEGTFSPPTIPLGEAWLVHPEFGKPANGPARFGAGLPLPGRDPAHSRLVQGPHGTLVLKDFGALESPEASTEFLRLLAAVGGAVHPALAPVVDGGLAPEDGTPRRWMATRYIPGISARDVADAEPLPAARVLRMLGPLAEGLAQLHQRGIVHRHISPGHVIVQPTDQAVLIDYRMAHSLENEPPAPDATPTERAYAAPEALVAGAAGFLPPVDVYGLAAVGQALLTGSRPDRGKRDVVLPVQRGAADRHALEGLLRILNAALAPDALKRPTAAVMAAALRKCGR
jgi:hypothetical protein